MKRFIYIGISTLIFGLSLYISAFRFLDHTSDPTSIDLVIRQYRTNLDEFTAMTEQLADRAKQLENNPESIQSLKEVFKNTRLAYKKIEFLAEYTSPEFVKDFFNGAPLPVIPRDTDAMEVKDPEGMQTLEELVYGDNPLEEKKKIVSLANKLTENAKEFIKIQRAIFLKDRFVFEAGRWQMIRVLTLGITGFDNPVEPNSLEEARVSLASVHASIKAYYPKLREKEVSLEKEMENLFVRADEYLKANNDFDSFDRLAFLKDFLNPLFKIILEAQKSISVPDMYIVNPAGTKFVYNYNADNIFAEDLINPYFFTELVKKQDSEELRKLGQALFYDPILSASQERSCASCHNPNKSFTDNEKKSIATGYEGTVDRNAPTLIHSVYANRYFYDLNTEKLEQQIQHVIFNPKEFNT
ncbi:MAG: cytochrome c peroxidase, partial [Bacteroidota bacterium]